MNASATLLTLSTLLLPLALRAAEPAASGPAPLPQASDASSGALAPLRPQAIELLKQACPARVDRLLRLAAPEALEDTALAADICLCADLALENTPDTTPVDSLQEVASTATLTCAQPGVTARNQALTRQQFADHLGAQGFSGRQMDSFSRCLAEGYWQASFAGLLQGRKTPLNGPALWTDCAEQVGRPGTPLPPPRHAAAPSSPTSTSTSTSTSTPSSPTPATTSPSRAAAAP